MTEAEWADIAENYTRETAELFAKKQTAGSEKKLAAQTTAETAGKSHRWQEQAGYGSCQVPDGGS